MTAGCSTQSTSSWRAGSGIVQAIVSLTSVVMPGKKCLLKPSHVCDFGVQISVCVFVCESDIPMSVGIVEPKTHPSQLNAAEFLWDMNKRTSVFVQVTNTHTHTLTLTSHAQTCISPLLRHMLGVPLNFHIKRIFWSHSYSCLPAVCRCTASAQSSPPGSTVERRASPSGSSSTRSPRERVESTPSTSTLPPAKSKSLRYNPILFLGWRRGGVVIPIWPIKSVFLFRSLLLCFLFSQRGRTVSKRQTGRRWRNAHLKRRRSTSLLMIPLSCQRSVYSC